MRVGIIMPSVHWNCPYADIYAKFFDKEGIHYDMISFNRKLDHEDTKYHFDYGILNSSGRIKKLIAIVRYCFFIYKILKREKYDRLVVFSSQLGIGLLPILLRSYKGKYIFDYRDLSVDQFLKMPFKLLLKYSYLNVISSPGFLRVLPKGFNYEVCHNFNLETVLNAINAEPEGQWVEGKRNILTIGGIRDYEANKEVIDAIKGSIGYTLSFVGRGESSEPLKKYCEVIGANNVSFSGFYKKEDEADIIMKSNFINIFYPRLLSHDTAVSNRFYNSLIFKKPMITTANTTQGDYAANYKVGIAINNCNNLINELEKFTRENDYFEYCQRCNKLLDHFYKDQISFERKVLEFTR